MVITTFIQNSLAIIWVVLVLAAIILVLGWALGRLLSWLLLRMLRKTRIIEVLSRWSKKPDTSPVELWIRRLIRWVVLLLSAWGAWSILYSHPDIRTFLDNVWTYIDNVFQLPLVVFLYDLVLITLITILLFKSFGWVKTGFASLSRRIEAERGNRVKGIKDSKIGTPQRKEGDRFLTWGQQVQPLFGRFYPDIDFPDRRVQHLSTNTRIRDQSAQQPAEGNLSWLD